MLQEELEADFTFQFDILEHLVEFLLYLSWQNHFGGLSLSVSACLNRFLQ